jgi:hypothetical protein
VGLQHQPDDRVLVRLRSNAPDGLTTEIRLPGDVVTGATRSSYLGEAGAALPVVDDSVTVTFQGSGVQALLLTLLKESYVPS